MNLAVVTVNLGNKAHNVAPVQQLLALRRLTARGVDVILVQEAHPLLVAPAGYRVVRQPGAGASQVPIVVRKTLPLVGSGGMRAHRGVEHKWPARWTTYVQIWSPELEQPVTVLNLHLNSKIDAGGVPARTNDDSRVTFARGHIEHARKVARFFTRFGPVIVGGDFNIDQDADAKHQHAWFPSAQLEAAGLAEVRTTKDTLGSRHVDRQFHSPSCRPANVIVLPRHAPNDHHPFLVGYRIGRP